MRKQRKRPIRVLARELARGLRWLECMHAPMFTGNGHKQPCTLFRACWPAVMHEFLAGVFACRRPCMQACMRHCVFACGHVPACRSSVQTNGPLPARAAEIATYTSNFDEAEKIYRDLDRRDLALELRESLGDWFKVVQLVQQGSGDDTQLAAAWNHIGDYFHERGKLAKASQYYAQV
eukprot:5865856-Pleurochrysis_carterae.AAC.2